MMTHISGCPDLHLLNNNKAGDRGGMFRRATTAPTISKVAATATMSTTVKPESLSSDGSYLYNSLKVGPMKRLYKYYTPQSINLAGGVPMEKCFPFKSLLVTVADDLAATTTATTAGAAAAALDVGSAEDTFTLLKEDKTLSLNYSRGDGLPELKEWIQSHTTSLHKKNASSAAFSTCITIGSTDAFAKILMLLKGDTVLFDEFAYGTALATAQVLGKNVIGVKMDAQGMIPESLRECVLKARVRGLEIACVYTIPVAHNPTGVSMSRGRKQALYEACRDLDLYLVEDDAYYYLSYGEGSVPGLRGLPDSLLSLDTDGRVIRLDSLSKFVAPGARIGWISAHPDFCAKYQLLQEITSQFPSSISQSIFLGLMKKWGEGGLDRHLKSVQSHYKQQRDILCDAIASHEYLKNHCEYVVPDGGMFIWLKLKHISLPSEEIFKLLAAQGVITVPGGDFFVSSRINADAAEVADPPIVRLTYAAVTREQIVEGVSRLAKGIEAARK